MESPRCKWIEPYNKECFRGRNPKKPTGHACRWWFACHTTPRRMLHLLTLLVDAISQQPFSWLPI